MTVQSNVPVPPVPMPTPGKRKKRLTPADLKAIGVGVGFLAPNIVGFMLFTLVPLVISLFMAFTDWNLELHNPFRHEPIRWVWFDNFIRLINEPDFYKFLGNTLFMMIGLPFGMAGSLVAALLLNRDFKAGRKRGIWLAAIAGAVLVGSTMLLTAVGLYGVALMTIFMSLLAGIWVGGTAGGQSVYRTLFYFPNFTAGVATYILWKRMYSPQNGPINHALQPQLDFLQGLIVDSGLTTATATAVFGYGLAAVWLAVMLWRTRACIKHWLDVDMGTGSLLIGMAMLLVPGLAAWSWTPLADKPWIAYAASGLVVAALAAMFVKGRTKSCAADYGMTQGAIFNGAFMCLGFLLLGLAGLGAALPGMAAEEAGIKAPLWLASYHWAKPAIIFMGLWSAFGSNNMLLYLAGLSGISQELYEAADLDGASPWQRFWNVTWPQLSNVTFFIFVMAVIGGLQGGFEMARAMTNGGPAGATTTLSYYIYTEGFSTGRLGYASAVSWALFALVMVVTLFNWKFGSRYTND